MQIRENNHCVLGMQIRCCSAHLGQGLSSSYNKILQQHDSDVVTFKPRHKFHAGTIRTNWICVTSK